jgi:hypothetical protein
MASIAGRTPLEDLILALDRLEPHDTHPMMWEPPDQSGRYVRLADVLATLAACRETPQECKPGSHIADCGCYERPEPSVSPQMSDLVICNQCGFQWMRTNFFNHEKVWAALCPACLSPQKEPSVSPQTPRKLHMALNVALRRIGGVVPSCDRPDECSICQLLTSPPSEEAR